MNTSVAEVALNPDRPVADPILGMLHRTAQPLCTIRGILELTLTEAMTAEEKSVWLQKAVEQISQACTRFDQLRQIVEKQARSRTEARAMHV
ncbi:MAG TPA: hypothetical protein VMT67_03580 [Terriglobales bacterium]|nr:hypothetical protein [Terriglobales bacterium]